MTPIISVVIPSYNHAVFIRQAVTSVLAQPFELEVVIVDDGSRDDSLAVLAAIEDPRVRVLPQENQGAHAAINRGLHEARGRFLAVLNSDDLYSPGRFAAALDVFERDPEVALVGSYIEVIDAHGRALGIKEGYHTLDPWPVPEPAKTFKADGDLRTALLMQNYWSTTSNFVLPRATYERYGPFQALRYCHDWDFALRVQREQRAHLIAEPLLQYRVHGSNTIRENRAAMIFEICWVLATHLPNYLGQEWFWKPGVDQRIEQLLHSVHLFGCEAVFWPMLAQIHFGPPEGGARLLEPHDEARQVYLSKITAILAAETPASQAEHADTGTSDTSAPSRRRHAWTYFKQRLLGVAPRENP